LPRTAKATLSRIHQIPNSVLEFPVNELGLHPTAEPVGLLEFLIETYTRPGEIVLDPTMEMDSTGIAAANTGRRFVGIENETLLSDRDRSAGRFTTGFRLTPDPRGRYRFTTLGAA